MEMGGSNRNDSYRGFNKPTFLLVEEWLASGRAIIIAFNSEGLPVKSWDIISLPRSWRESNRWNPSGVTFLHCSRDRREISESDRLHPGNIIDMARWLAKTYCFYQPLLGEKSLILSSRLVFIKQVESALKELPPGSVLVEIGGAKVSKPPNVGRVLSIGPTYSTTNHGNSNLDRYQQISGIIEELPLPNDSAECVISLFVLEHTIDPILGLREVSRVLKPGGLFILGIPVDHSPAGNPPFFHRWRFTSASKSKSARTIALNDINIQAEGLMNPKGKPWQFSVKSEQAQLFLFRKVS